MSPAVKPRINSSISAASCSPPSRLRSMKVGTCMALLEGDERFADGPGLPEAEKGCKSGRDIGEGPAGAERQAGPAIQDHERDLFTGVIRSAPRRIVAVVGGDNDEVVL